MGVDVHDHSIISVDVPNAKAHIALIQTVCLHVHRCTCVEGMGFFVPAFVSLDDSFDGISPKIVRKCNDIWEPGAIHSVV